MRASTLASGAAVAACALMSCAAILGTARPSRGAAVELASLQQRGSALPLASLVREEGAEQRDELVLDRLSAEIARGRVTSLFSQSLEEGCNSWRGCAPTPRALVPKEVKFECGGDSAAESCVEAVKKCTASADADAQRLFETQPKVATELRAEHNCKCFVSNGCKPECNVAMYMIWSAGSSMRCKSQPPVYLESSGAYQYGNPYTNRVLPSDLSFDYFPDFPNPAGHIMNVPSVRHSYAQDPKTGYEYPTYPRTAGYSGYEPSPYVDAAQAPVAAPDVAAAAENTFQSYYSPYGEYAAASRPWTPMDSPSAPSSVADPWGYWANHNLDYRPYDETTGEGKYYAPYAQAYYYYDPSSGHVYLQ